VGARVHAALRNAVPSGEGGVRLWAVGCGSPSVEDEGFGALGQPLGDDLG
jgi:hypothetical protein